MITTTASVRNSLALLAEVILALIKPSFSLALLAFCSVVMELMAVAALLLLWSYALLLCFRPAPTLTTAPTPGPTTVPPTAPIIPGTPAPTTAPTPGPTTAPTTAPTRQWWSDNRGWGTRGEVLRRTCNEKGS